MCEKPYKAWGVRHRGVGDHGSFRQVVGGHRGQHVGRREEEGGVLWEG